MPLLSISGAEGWEQRGETTESRRRGRSGTVRLTGFATARRARSRRRDRRQGAHRRRTPRTLLAYISRKRPWLFRETKTLRYAETIVRIRHHRPPRLSLLLLHLVRGVVRVPGVQAVEQFQCVVDIENTPSFGEHCCSRAEQHQKLLIVFHA